MPRMPVGFGAVPFPEKKAVASSSSFASWNSIAISLTTLPQSSDTSKLIGTNACTRLTVIDGWASVGVLSEASAASDARAAVIAADVVPSHVLLPVIVTTRLIARNGLTLKFDVGMTVGSRVNGIGTPVDVVTSAVRSSLVISRPEMYFTNARFAAGEPVPRIRRRISPDSVSCSRSRSMWVWTSSRFASGCGNVAASMARLAWSPSILTSASCEDESRRTAARS